MKAAVCILFFFSLLSAQSQRLCKISITENKLYSFKHYDQCDDIRLWVSHVDNNIILNIFDSLTFKTAELKSVFIVGEEINLPLQKLKTFYNLENLSVYSNINEEGFPPEICLLKKLKRLELQYFEDTLPNCIIDLKDMEYLNISFSKVIIPHNTLSHLPELKEIEIGGGWNKFDYKSAFIELSKSPSLESVIIFAHRIEDLSYIDTLVNVKSLRICFLGRIKPKSYIKLINKLSSLENLEDLSIVQEKPVRILSLPESINRLTKIKRISLYVIIKKIDNIRLNNLELFGIDCNEKKIPSEQITKFKEHNPQSEIIINGACKVFYRHR